MRIVWCSHHLRAVQGADMHCRGVRDAELCTKDPVFVVATKRIEPIFINAMERYAALERFDRPSGQIRILHDTVAILGQDGLQR